MATKYAVANGNWSAGATWNGGVVPQSGDVVYCNGHTITLNVDVNIGQGILRNGALADYNINNGGYFICPTGHRIVMANILAESGYLFFLQAGGGSSISIIGNCEANGANVSIFRNASSNAGTTYGSVTGNVYINNGAIFNTQNRPVGDFVISGNVFVSNGSKIANYDGITLNINGNLTDYNINANTIETLSVANLFVGMLVVTTLNISGSITYKSTNNTMGVRYTTLNILNPDTFTWKDISEPRSNPFIIVTDAEMNNRQQYPAEDEVKEGTEYAWGEKVGTYTPDYPQEAEVLQGVTYDNGNKTGTLTPVILGDYPDVDKVLVGTIFDYGDKVGTFQPVADYPAEADVLQGVEYAYGQMTGTLSVATDYPQEANVLLGVEYANGSMVGTLEVVQMQADYPSEDDVRFDVPFDFGNKLGKCHVPIPEDVRDGVPVDVNEVGTLIPSSGGDRLRIADFGYYTNAQSDTYIVDLTEQDKPKFAVAEERVLIEMFPDLDLDNIPDKYFDDLFVKYLKYRLIVEYYRTAGINSTFTPSEPTTEIVNYQNVRNEVWLNSANIYLKAWGKKYPNSIKEHRIIL